MRVSALCMALVLCGIALSADASSRTMRLKQAPSLDAATEGFLRCNDLLRFKNNVKTNGTTVEAQQKQKACGACRFLARAVSSNLRRAKLKKDTDGYYDIAAVQKSVDQTKDNYCEFGVKAVTDCCEFMHIMVRQPHRKLLVQGARTSASPQETCKTMVYC